MIKTETNSLYVSGLSAMEVESYFEKFGEEGWLDCEEKILISVKDKNEYQISKLENFFNIILWKTVNIAWIIVDLSDMKKD